MVSSMNIPKRMVIIAVLADFLLHYSFKGISRQYVQEESGILYSFFHNELYRNNNSETLTKIFDVRWFRMQYLIFKNLGNLILNCSKNLKNFIQSFVLIWNGSRRIKCKSKINQIRHGNNFFFVEMPCYTESVPYFFAVVLINGFIFVVSR